MRNSKHESSESRQSFNSGHNGAPSDKNTGADFFQDHRMLKDVLNTIPVRVFWKDLNSVYIGCNKLFAEDSGLKSPSEINGLTDFDIRDEHQALLNRQDDRNIIESGEARVNYEELLITPEGEKRWILTSKSPLRTGKGEIYGVLGTYKDITERKVAEDELRVQKSRLSNILHGSNVGTWEWHLDTGENVINDHWAEILGFEKEEMPLDDKDFWKNFVHPDDIDRVDAVLKKHFDNETQYFKCEFRMNHKDGHWVWVNSRGKVVERNAEGGPVLLCGTHQDISKRKYAEEQLLHQLVEKDTVIQETNHRIKNNIASIASILAMHADSVKSDEAKTALQDAMSRVQSMQVLYEKLLLDYTSSQVPIQSYLNELIDGIFSVYDTEKNIEVKNNICDYQFSSRVVLYIGLIVNEIITNALKYAFTGISSGLIDIILDNKGRHFNLVIKDNGRGVPDNFDLKTDSGFGLMLVGIMCEQLGGKYFIDNVDSGGMKFSLEFDLD